MTGSPSRRLARWVLVGALAFTLLFPVIYAVTVPEQIGAPEMLPNVPDGTYRVYVVDWGYHTAIVVPQPGRSAADFSDFVRDNAAIQNGGVDRMSGMSSILGIPPSHIRLLAQRAD